MDDTFTYGLMDDFLAAFLKHLSSIHQCIEFTIERETNGELHFHMFWSREAMYTET